MNCVLVFASQDINIVSTVNYLCFYLSNNVKLMRTAYLLWFLFFNTPPIKQVQFYQHTERITS